MVMPDIDTAALDRALKVLFPVYLKDKWAKIDQFEKWMEWHFSRVHPMIIAEYHKQRTAP